MGWSSVIVPWPSIEVGLSLIGLRTYPSVFGLAEVAEILRDFMTVSRAA